MLRVGAQHPRRQAAIACVTADRGAGTAGAGTAHHPGRHRVRLLVHLPEDRLGDVVVGAPVGGALGVGELVHEVAAAFAGEPDRLGGDVTRCAHQVPRSRAARARGRRPPWTSIAAVSSGVVDAGITATNGGPSRLAKYASDTAVEPLEASTTMLPECSQPLASAYRNSDRASRC